jgi:hypothetical protein
MTTKRSEQPKKQDGKLWPKVMRHRSVDGKKIKLRPLETATHLRLCVEYDDGATVPIGAMLLNTGTLDKPEYRLRYVWKCSGIHDYQDAIQAEATIAGIQSLIRELPQGESLRVQYQCFPDTTDRELELAQTFRDMPESEGYASEICSQMILQEVGILREAHEKGRRKTVQIYITATYTARTEQLEKDGIEKITEFLFSMPKNMFQKASGASKLLAEEELDRFLLRGYESGYLFWATMFRERLQMDVQPLNAEAVWQFCRSECNRFSDRIQRREAITNNLPYEVRNAPHLIYYDLQKAEIVEISNSTLHPTSLIHEEVTSIPATGRDYVYVDGKYLGCLYLKSQPAYFAGTGKRSLHQVQLNYLWDILAKPFCYDVQVVLEATTVDQMAVNLNNQDLITQASQQLKLAESKGKVDVRAEMHLEEAIANQRSIVGGDPTLDYALTVYFYRDTLSEMRSAVNQFRRCFRAPATMLQDLDTADAPWLQMLPYYGKSLLVDMRDRRDRTSAAVLASYLPLLVPQSPHKKGMEFISIKGGIPIYFDPFEGDNQGHIALWAKTRSGKSVLAAWFINRSLAAGVKTTIIDQPPSSEASTFKDFVNKMGGGYVDIMNHGINMFDIPNIPANASEEQAKDLKQESQIYLLRVLRAMALGDIEDSSPLTKRIEALLPVILTNFWNNQNIKLRYTRARTGGIGSQAWVNHPILQDFMEFCHPSMIGMLNPSEDDFEAFAYIRNQFTRWVKGPHAKVLNTPSTISIDEEPLLAIAMRGISNNDEGAVFGSLLYLVAMRRAIAASATVRGSLLFIDEAAISFRIKAIAEAAALAMANGLKARMRVMLASQEPESVAKATGGAKMMDAISYHLIGRIGTESLAAYEKYLNLPRDLAVMNAGDGFKPDKATNSSRWLLKFGDNFVPVVAYLPALLVDLTANNVDERISRREREAAATQVYINQGVQS